MHILVPSIWQRIVLVHVTGFLREIYAILNASVILERNETRLARNEKCLERNETRLARKDIIINKIFILVCGLSSQVA